VNIVLRRRSTSGTTISLEAGTAQRYGASANTT